MTLSTVVGLAAFLCVSGLFGGDPAGFGGLAGAAESQGSGGDVFGDAAGCCYVGSGLDGDGGYEGGVGADEDVIADGSEVLIDRKSTV